MKTINLNQKMIAVMIGVAVFAIAGVSVASAQTSGSTNQTNTPPQIQGSINTEQLLLSNVKTNFSDAANTAASAVTNGRVIGGSLTEAQGYLVYAFKVIDDKNMAYSVIIDPANGKVLYTSTGHPFHMGGFGMGQGMMKRGHMGAWHSQNAPTTGTNTPSAVTSDTNPSGLT
jgi:uncharacterized membrane protein YkoI